MKFYGTLLVIVALVIGALLWLKSEQAKVPAAASAGSTPTVRSQPAVAAPAGPPVAAPAPAVNKRPAFEALASRLNLRLVSWQEGSDSAVVQIQWIGDSSGPGGDFLDAALREGLLRDFDDMGSRQGADKQGRRAWEATYRVKW